MRSSIESPSFFSLLLSISRRNHKAEERRSGFRPRCLFLERHLEQNQLRRLGPWWVPAARRVRGSFPVQEPLMRAEIEKGQLRGPEDRFGHARVAHPFDMFAIIEQFHTVRGRA